MTATAATLTQRWYEAVDSAPEDVFLVYEDSGGRPTTWTYRQFAELVHRVEAGMWQRGIRSGDRLLLVLRNSPAFVALWLAACDLGACIVPVDPQSSSPELDHFVARTRPVLVVCGTRTVDAVSSVVAARDVPHLVVDDDDVDLAALRGPSPAQRFTPMPRPDTPAAIMFTSGTTSAPKGVVVTQANYAFAGDVMSAAAAVHRWDRLLVVLPLFHANAQYYSFCAAISAAAGVALMSGFSASRFTEQAATYGATHASLFAAPMRMILARGAQDMPGLRLRHCWYAQNVTDDQYQEISELFGCRPRQLYGMTETIPAVLTNRAVGPRPRAMGQPTLGCQVDLDPLQSKTRSVDQEIGEIVVRGVPGITLFAGYLDDPETTQRAFAGGVFHTEDRAWRDGDGYYYFAGRSSDVLKVAGENVSVVEVEEVLARHPAVFEAAVVGESDPIRDEIPVAYVVLSSGFDRVSVDDLERYCADRLAPAKRPRRIHLVSELPRTSVGKVRKFLLPDLVPGSEDSALTNSFEAGTVPASGRTLGKATS